MDLFNQIHPTSIWKTLRFVFEVYNSYLSMKQIYVENFSLKNVFWPFQSFKGFQDPKENWFSSIFKGTLPRDYGFWTKRQIWISIISIETFTFLILRLLSWCAINQGRVLGLVWAHRCYGNVGFVYTNDTLWYI